MKSVVLEVVVVAPDDYDSQDAKGAISEILAMMDVFLDQNVRVVKEGAVDGG